MSNFSAEPLVRPIHRCKKCGVRCLNPVSLEEHEFFCEVVPPEKYHKGAYSQ